MGRTVTVISTQGDSRVTLESNASNWGELKREINAEGTFNADQAKAMIRGSRTPLSKDSDSIPHEPFSLFLTPEKIKSGK
jgi:hypothetical protein